MCVCVYLRPASISRSLERDERFIVQPTRVYKSAGYADSCIGCIFERACYVPPWINPGLTTRLRERGGVGRSVLDPARGTRPFIDDHEERAERKKEGKKKKVSDANNPGEKEKAHR